MVANLFVTRRLGTFITQRISESSNAPGKLIYFIDSNRFFLIIDDYEPKGKAKYYRKTETSTSDQSALLLYCNVKFYLTLPNLKPPKKFFLQMLTFFNLLN